MKKAMFFFTFFVLFLFSCSVTNKKIYEIEKRGKLVVGTSPPYGVMEFYENNEIVGFDIDLAREIANRLNLDLEIKEVDFDKFYEALENDEIDLMIASVTITKERNEKMEFSIPYFNGGQAIVSKKNFQNYEDLSGKKILIEDDGTKNKKKIFEYVKNFTAVFYAESYGKPYYEYSLEQIKNESIDAFVIDYVAALDALKENENLTIIDIFTDEYYGIAAKKGNTDLINKINDILIDLKNEKVLENLKNKWVSNN
ncbi:MAG: transporter substrate-binding domain-containing protein [Candidatus Woesearchaeota archaeon]